MFFGDLLGNKHESEIVIGPCARTVSFSQSCVSYCFAFVVDASITIPSWAAQQESTGPE